MSNRLAYFYSAVLIIFTSCTGNHYHDGIYAKGFGETSNLQDEIIRLDGDHINVYTYTSGATLTGETKLKCTQFEDRIEYEVRGDTRVIRVIDSGQLKLNDIDIYKRMGNLTDSFTVTPRASKAVIKQKEDGTIEILP